jgi:hypothetical protein
MMFNINQTWNCYKVKISYTLSCSYFARNKLLYFPIWKSCLNVERFLWDYLIIQKYHQTCMHPFIGPTKLVCMTKINHILIGSNNPSLK